MPPKPANQIASATVKAMAMGGMGRGNTTAPTQPPNKKTTDVKTKVLVSNSKDDTLHPPPMTSATTNRPIIGRQNNANSIKTSPKKKTGNNTAASSNISKHSNSNVGGGAGGGSSRQFSTSHVSSAFQAQQAKLERAQTAKRELAEMDAIERAFREDATVWAGPSNVVFPRRYGAEKEEYMIGTGDLTQKKDNEKSDHDKQKSSIHNPYMSFYGSQSQGWMYGEGHAGIGGRSWMEATTPSHIADKRKKKKDKKIGTKASPHNMDDATTNKSNASFLMDEVAIIENCLQANGLTRHDVTPTAYACFLEQARRYALELLADAQDYAIHAQRTTLPALLPADLLLAAEMREDGGGGVQGVSSTLPTPAEVADLASEVNRAPLPPIPTNCYNGIAMPPAEQQLTARTYDVVNATRVAQRMMMGGDLPLTVEDITTGGGGVRGIKGPSSKNKKWGAYGAGKGRQISVHIKGKTSGSLTDGNASGISTTGTNAATAKAAAATAGGKTTTKSVSKGQKRRLTEL